MIYVDVGFKPAIPLKTFIKRLSCQVQLISSVYFQDFGVDGQATLNHQVTATLLLNAPEQLAKIDLTPVYGPQEEKLPDEYDFRHLDRLAKIFNKSPSKLPALKDLLNEARYNPHRSRYFNDILVQLRLKDEAQPVKQIYCTRDSVLQAVKTAKMEQNYKNGKADEGDKYSQRLPIETLKTLGTLSSNQLRTLQQRRTTRNSSCGAASLSQTTRLSNSLRPYTSRA
ncbi:hypothetical protein SARC_09740 [Sphaeroforma arctica JP610]|uniref:Uncharacterized protein n=1 Tax=Sphaeroforma arctica JP610 TaxID=667725 RepID=A0A0L0FMS6_9EUKA|nr:hypothetical protein SARC_09740 [Sphaeroforma arctica JP610]KNC77811.1 hypothetical protein SARC_09740 [Sphaeroforma arctica JP610]|eukprot:XP_014151713.1 hypothetical protein SARC_09740 [Sphaeroforma arctica JP610]